VRGEMGLKVGVPWNVARPSSRRLMQLCITPPHIVRDSEVSVLQKYSRDLSAVALRMTHSQGPQPSKFSLHVFKSITPSAVSVACNIKNRIASSSIRVHIKLGLGHKMNR